MIACEPSDSVLAALLQANDDLLATVNSWDTTASRLVMLQSKSAATTSVHSQQSATRVATTPDLSDSSSNSASDMTPTTAASGGVFWSHLEAGPPVKPRSTPQETQQQRQPQAERSQQSYPSLLDSGPAQRQDGVSMGSQQHDSSQRQSSSHLDDLAGLQPQYPHQSLAPNHQQNRGDASWHGFMAGRSMPSALSSVQSEGQNRAASHAGGPQEFHGTVLSYRLAAPKHTDGSDQQSLIQDDSVAEAPMQGSQSRPEAATGAEPSSRTGPDARQQPFDPFAGASSMRVIEPPFTNC